MRFIRYRSGVEEPKFGWVLEDQVGEIEGTPFGDFRRKEADIHLPAVHLLAPLLPGKIIGIEMNFQKPLIEGGEDLPEIPALFLKPSSSVIGPRQVVLLPPQAHLVEHEVHLAVIIGRKGRWIEPDQARDYIFGYTIATDITARDLETADHTSGRAKGFDTFLPLGPWIETDLDVIDSLLTCRVKGELRQMASTREMIFTVSQIVAFISSIMTLSPGDVILTGSPAGAGPLAVGDIIQSSVEGIGDLINPVAAESG